MEEKRPQEVRATHTARKAKVYIRQSTGEQVRKNQGSTKFQRGQVRWAREWGWSNEQIEIVDEDLGLSGASADHRQGYQRVVAEIVAGEVGALFISDLTRAGRDAFEWFRLLNLCRDHDVLIVVAGKIYDPRDASEMFFTRLIATIGEHENLMRRENMRRGLITKAKSGFAVTNPPAGYIRKKKGKWSKDPDADVRRTIETVFRVFREQRTCRRTVEALKAMGVKLPRRRRAEVRWVEPQVCTVHAMITNRAYMGTYVFVRRQADSTLGRDARGRVRLRLSDPDNVVTIPGHHEAYIDAATFEEVQSILRASAPSQEHRNLGPGEGLVQGIVFCQSHPKRVMSTGYKGRRTDENYSHSYGCRGDYDHDGTQCIRVAGKWLDQAVARAIFDRLSPPSIEMIRQAAEHAQAGELSERHRVKMDLHRARQQAEEAEYRFRAVDAGNRLVARKLEADWEDAERQVARLERLTDKVVSDDPPIDDGGLRELQELCADLNSIWNAETTEDHDRKEIVRTLVRRVEIGDRTTELLNAKIIWNDDVADTAIEIKHFGHTRRLLADMHADGMSAEAIAARLNALGIVTRYGNKWTDRAVASRIRQLERRGEM